tara:strand:+ start:170 stop:394 length:225 start_codon:yes stop_codon:yes gene_type:complete
MGKLSEDKETLEQLEGLKKSLEEWEQARKKRLWDEVAFLQSIKSNIKVAAQNLSINTYTHAVTRLDGLKGNTTD